MHVDKIITVKLTPRASKNEIIFVSDNMYKVRVTAPPVGGAANQALVMIISDYFSISQSCIEIIKGHKGRLKTVRVTS